MAINHFFLIITKQLLIITIIPNSANIIDSNTTVSFPPMPPARQQNGDRTVHKKPATIPNKLAAIGFQVFFILIN